MKFLIYLPIVTGLFFSCNNNPDKLIKKGDYYYNKSEYDYAIVKYSKALKINPKNYTAVFKIGNSYLAKKDTLRTIYYYTIAANNHYNNYEMYKFLGLYYKQIKDTNLAMNNLTLAIKCNKEDYECLTERGELHLQKNELDNANNDFALAIKTSEPYVQLLLSYTENERKYKEVEERIIEYMKPYIYKAKIKELKNDYYGLINDYNFLIDALPLHYELYLKRGIIKQKLNKSYDACLDFSIAKENGIKDADLYFKKNCATCTK